MDVGEGWVGNKEWLYTALSEVQKWPLFPCNMFLASVYNYHAVHKIRKPTTFFSLRNSKCSGLDRQNSSKTTSKAKM